MTIPLPTGGGIAVFEVPMNYPNIFVHGLYGWGADDGIAPEDIFVERDGKQIPYADLVKEVELPDGTE